MKLFAPGPSQQRLTELLLPLLEGAFPQLQATFPLLDWDTARLTAHPHQGYRSHILEMQAPPDLRLIAKVRQAEHQPAGFVREQQTLLWLRSRGLPCAEVIGLQSLQHVGQCYWVLLLVKLAGRHLRGSDNYASLGKYLRRLNGLAPPYPEHLPTMQSRPLQQWTLDSLSKLAGLNFFTRAEERTLTQLLDPLGQPWLEQALDRACLVHNDPHAFNVLVNPSRRVQAMLDWESALVGPAEYQLASALAFLAQPGRAVTPAQIDQRQQELLRGYGHTWNEGILALQIVRQLDILSRHYQRDSYRPEGYHHAYLQSPVKDLEDYDRRVLWQCEADLRRRLAAPR